MPHSFHLSRCSEFRRYLSADEALKIYAAGSLLMPLKEAIAASGLAAETVAAPVFGLAGLLRQRIEKGEFPDFFLSPNMAHPQVLVASKRAMMAVPFARNHLCLLSRKSLGATNEAVVDKMLDPKTRLDGVRKDGNGTHRRTRHARRQGLAVDRVPWCHDVGGRQDRSRIDLPGQQGGRTLYYCSGQADTLRDVPGLVSNRLPAKIDVIAVYGIAIMSRQPDALRFALFLLSDKGQSILAAHGLVPLVESE